MINSIEDTKAFLNVTGSDDDALITSLIEAAESWIDRWLATPMAEMATVPADLKHAVKMLVGHFYENREATLVGVTAEEVPFGVWDIVNQHRAWSF
ncbi:MULTISPECIES: head-tail connector protein [Chelativorans]|jgi:uncharacterized phage protein (predicted DNA packaging)|uniref:Uncharacterized phage protein n=1 Tax=Chelativorans sp. (strain BNC1) TaxID=266779 RepID=Q11H43_CHESB|nr:MULTISPECIES: head-tail connector protein [Chelativorans]